MIEWVAIDETGTRVAAGCPQSATVWREGKARHFKLPPSVVIGAAFRNDGELWILISEGIENRLRLFALEPEGRELREVRSFPGKVGNDHCENAPAASQLLTVLVHDGVPSKSRSVLQLGPRSDVARFSIAPKEFSLRNCITLADGALLRWVKGTGVETAVPAVLERIQLNGAIVRREIFTRQPVNKIHSYSGTSLDGSWAAFLEPAPNGSPIGLLYVVPTHGRGKREPAWLAQVGATRGVRLCLYGMPCSSGLLLSNAAPVSSDTVVLLSTARAAVVSKHRWCDIALDERSWARGVRASYAKFVRAGSTFAVPARNGQVFVFDAQC